jgi:hypothetical protein
MIEYILCGIVITYYGTFCGALAYVEFKDRQEERRKIIRSYEQINMQEKLDISMHEELEIVNIHRGLYPIQEVDEIQRV